MDKLFQLLDSTAGKILILTTFIGIISGGTIAWYEFDQKNKAMEADVIFLKQEAHKVQQIEHLDEELHSIEEYKKALQLELKAKQNQIDSLSLVLSNEIAFRKTLVKVVRGETDTWYWDKFVWSREDTLHSPNVVRIEMTNDQNYWYFNDNDEVFKAFYEKKDKLFKFVDSKTKRVQYVPFN